MQEYAYPGHNECTFQCTNMCTSNVINCQVAHTVLAVTNWLHNKLSSFVHSFSVTKSKFRLCVQLMICHYLCIIGHCKLLLECHQPHHKHSSHWMSQRSATLLGLQSSLWHVTFSKLNLFLYWLQTCQRSELFFSSGDSNVF